MKGYWKVFLGLISQTALDWKYPWSQMILNTVPFQNIAPKVLTIMISCPYSVLDYFSWEKTKQNRDSIFSPTEKKFICWLKNSRSILNTQHRRESPLFYRKQIVKLDSKIPLRNFKHQEKCIFKEKKLPIFTTIKMV